MAFRASCQFSKSGACREMETRNTMKRTWDIEELVKHFTLLPQDMDLLANKTGPTRFGFAVLLKYFQYEARFPAAKQDVPKALITYLTNQLNLSPELYLGCKHSRNQKLE